MDRRRAIGRYGENVATRRLMLTGVRVLERNWRCRWGEIDIVALEPAEGFRAPGTLVICEVKTRRAGGFQVPLAGLGRRQTARLRDLAERWMAERWLPEHGTPPAGGVRLDLIGVLIPRRGAPVLEHVRGVA
ncbi:YraN family protein [Streptomyces sp. ST2-7A]|uniref:YraN family protein n=1 Tax=Streptomyces sp. ST2-7A TaxID=2907214 RepID=UPI001F31AEA1|nr:YraN family protein [Streptomyces sp. ST2-7A]MCE7079961.1 YraN family protein [Streptomyces sp. ST2-7A]